MSYARWSEGDVYLYHTGKEFICQICPMATNEEDFTTASRGEILYHLLEHRNKGHMVPERAIERLRAEMSGVKTNEAAT